MGGGTLFSQSRLSDFGLVGKVESVQCITLNVQGKTAVSGFLDSEIFDSVFLKFDKRRNLILQENYLDYRGKIGIFDRTLFQINPQNQIEKIQTILIQNGEEPQKISQLKTFYYLRNNLIRLDEFNSGRTSDQMWVTNYLYNGGNLVEKIFWMEDAIFSRTKFSYNLNHEILSEKTYHNNGQLGKTTENEFNNFGLIQKKISKSGNEITIESFRYGDFYKSFYELSLKTGEILRTETYENNGLIKEIQKFDYEQNQLVRYEFQFQLDSVGNWIECVISVNKSPTYTLKRIINYFK